MTFHVFLFLLSVCLLLSLARLGRLGWLPLQPSHSAVASRRSPVHRLLKPRTPLDCPCCHLGSTPSSGGEPVPAPMRPWREMKSRRGAPKRVNTEGFACPNPQCPYAGITDAGVHALVGDGTHGRTERIQTFRCQACRTTFTARRHTPFYRLKTPSHQIAVVLSALAEGLDPSAAEVCPVFPHAKDQRHWSFPDPSKATGSKEEQLAVYRRVRDAIRQRIEDELLTTGQPEKDDLPARALQLRG